MTSIAETLPLDHVEFADVFRPATEARSLPAHCYTGSDFFKLEVDRIFMKTWNCVGHASRIPSPGDCFSFDLAGIPLIVARGTDGVARAFANGCRHRGTKLLEGQKNCRTIVCPYHSWSYGLDGRLLAAPTAMDRTVGFNLADYSLKQLRLEEWNGFLFINCDPDAPTINEYVGNLTALLAPYRLGELVQTWRKSYLVKCNWKNYLENARDQLHVSTVHRRTFERTVPVTKINRELLPSDGAYSSAYIMTSRTTALLEGDEGFPYRKGLTARYAEGTHTSIIYPGLYIGATLDCGYSLTITPVDVSHTRIEIAVMFEREITERDDFEEVSKRYQKTFIAISEEDNAINELQYAGLNSPLAQPGPFSWREEGIHWICRWVAGRIVGESAPTPTRVAAK